MAIAVSYLVSIQNPLFSLVIPRIKATKNLILSVAAEILRGVYPESTEGLRMTKQRFRMDTNYCKLDAEMSKP
jgi:hypothetical protein